MKIKKEDVIKLILYGAITTFLAWLMDLLDRNSKGIMKHALLIIIGLGTLGFMVFSLFYLIKLLVQIFIILF